MREPGIGELTGRIDDLEAQLDGVRKIVLVAVIIGVVLWFDLREGKAKDARED